jgi:hypothetical protein
MRRTYLIIIFILILVALTTGYFIYKKRMETEQKNKAALEYSPEEKIDGQYIGLIKFLTLLPDSTNYSLGLDNVEWVNCGGSDEDCPNGYQITNNEEEILTFKISPRVKIKLQTYSHQVSGNDIGNYNWNEDIALEKFASLFNESGNYDPKNLLYSVTLKDGAISEITEQYQP